MEINTKGCSIVVRDINETLIDEYISTVKEMLNAINILLMQTATQV